MRRCPRCTSCASASSARSAKRSGAGVAVDPAQQGAQTRSQLAQRERLDEVVVGAGVEALDAIVDRVARGEHEHRGAVAGLAHAPADLEAVEPGHAHVEDHGVGRRGGQPVECRSAICREVHVVAFERKRPLERGPDGRLVVDDQDPHFWSIGGSGGFRACIGGD